MLRVLPPAAGGSVKLASGLILIVHIATLASGRAAQECGGGAGARKSARWPATTITGSYIAEIKAPSQDSQAIAGWNGPGPYTITNNYLEAASENRFSSSGGGVLCPNCGATQPGARLLSVTAIKAMPM